MSKKDTLENDFPYIYSAKKFKKETERKNSPSLSKKDILDFPYIYQWGKKFEKEEEDGFTILVKERHLGLSIYPFINGEKKFEKEEEDGFSILVLPWRTIFHIFIGGVKI